VEKGIDLLLIDPGGKKEAIEMMHRSCKRPWMQ